MFPSRPGGPPKSSSSQCPHCCFLLPLPIPPSLSSLMLSPSLPGKLRKLPSPDPHSLRASTSVRHQPISLPTTCAPSFSSCSHKAEYTALLIVMIYWGNVCDARRKVLGVFLSSSQTQNYRHRMSGFFSLQQALL